MFERTKSIVFHESLGNPIHVLRCLGELAIILPLEDLLNDMKTALSEANDVFPED